MAELMTWATDKNFMGRNYRWTYANDRRLTVTYCQGNRALYPYSIQWDGVTITSSDLERSKAPQLMNTFNNLARAQEVALWFQSWRTGT